LFIRILIGGFSLIVTLFPTAGVSAAKKYCFIY
jgi:hypothetical protein